MFARIADVVTSRLSGQQSSSSSMAAPASSSPSSSSSSSSSVAYMYAQMPYSNNKNNLRLSSSLQDLTAYRPLDNDVAIANVDNRAAAAHVKFPHLLHRDNAAVSSFSKERGVGGGTLSKRSKFLRLFMLMLCLVLLGVLIYMISVYVYSYWSRGESKFYVVLDCGSTGTRVYVYQASFDHNNAGTLPIALKSFTEGIRKKPSSQIGRAYDRMETEPGFHKLVHNVTGLKGAIKPLIRWAEKQIPRNAHKSTSLFLYATAGVRRLPKADSEWLLDNARSILKTSPFRCEKNCVKIISGAEEAYFGWIALNHRTGL
nr:probable apyrase 7 [Quercus suber]